MVEYRVDPPRRGAKAEASRNDILSAAAGMMRRNGYAEMSLREVAAKVQKKAGSLYYHFASKDELGTEVMRIGVEAVEADVITALEALDDASPELRLFTAVRTHLDALLKRSDFVSSHIRCYPFVPDTVRDDLRAVRRSYDRLWLVLIRDYLGPGASRDQVHYLRHILIGALNQSLEWFNPNRDSIDDYAREIETILSGYRKV